MTTPVEIVEALSCLTEYPFDAAKFPYAFLEAFGHKPATTARLKNSNKTDIHDTPALLEQGHIHIAVSPAGLDAEEMLARLRGSPASERRKARYLLATDGQFLRADDRKTGLHLSCPLTALPDHFGFFLPLAGFQVVPSFKVNLIDVRATNRLNKLYKTILKDNPEWGKKEKLRNMTRLFAQLIFCFYADDAGIFPQKGMFAKACERRSLSDGTNSHEIIGTLLGAMPLSREEREKAGFPSWTFPFPHVTGGVFSGSIEIPRFSRAARSQLLSAGKLGWKQISPDIFGSMIQALTNEEERSALGMHYTSVPNILRVLNPLFLDNLREEVAAAENSPRKLLNLRKRMAKIRVFDPACGSGNFLVIAYKEMRAIEALINEKCQETGRPSEIRLTNFRGIELREFPAEIACLSLIIAKYQCDSLYCRQAPALANFLTLNQENWIVCGNALRMDWLRICPPAGKDLSFPANDSFRPPEERNRLAEPHEGGETFICGNPPYRGSTWQSDEQKEDMKRVFDLRVKNWKSLDYVAGWFMKAADYMTFATAEAAFVSTNSICQGQMVPYFWSCLFKTGVDISFAYKDFKWFNPGLRNAGVTVVIVGLSKNPPCFRKLYSDAKDGSTLLTQVNSINAYLIPGHHFVIEKQSAPVNGFPAMYFGNKPVDGGHLLLTKDEKESLLAEDPRAEIFIRPFIGSEEFIHGKQRYCLWIEDSQLAKAEDIPGIRKRIESVRHMRLQSKDKGANAMAGRPHQFREMYCGQHHTIVIPGVSSEHRPYLPVGIVKGETILSNANFALHDAPLWTLALLSSRLHLVWIGAVCGRLGSGFRYSNTMGWHIFPRPCTGLTDKNKEDLILCANDILMARASHSPATLADLYKPNAMPTNLLLMHRRNDEVVEDIYAGKVFKNDSQRLENLFELYARNKAQPIRCDPA